MHEMHGVSEKNPVLILGITETKKLLFRDSGRWNK